MMILRLALRDLRGGLSGLRLLAVCLFLGVAALAGVGSLTSAVLDGLADQGQAILGGDVQVEMNQREASPDESVDQAVRIGSVHIGQRRAAAGISDAHSGQVCVVGVSSALAWRRASSAFIGLTTKK